MTQLTPGRPTLLVLATCSLSLAAAFAPTARGVHVGAPLVAPARRGGGGAVCKQDIEEVTEKYGLEAGLFSALRQGRGGGGGDGGEGGDGDEAGKGGMATAGDLLKRYGGAYLLTSTSLALVSFSLCYVAVDNGIDVAALLQRLGIEVSGTSENVGTVGIAYALHKAASPIRFPPTVALTPVVAKNLFGKSDEDGEGESS